MKKLVVAVVALILLLVVAPWGVGRMAEARVNRGIDALVAAAPYIQVVDRQWTQGWFRSEQLATFEIGIPGLESIMQAAALARANAEADGEDDAAVAEAAPSPEPLRFQIRNEVLHGPVLGFSAPGLARVKTVVVLSEATRQKLLETFGTDEPVQVSTRAGFFGGGTTTLSGDARSISLDKLDPRETTGAISWDAFSFSVGMSRNADSYDLKGRQPRIEISDSKMQVLLTDITLDGSSERIAGDLYDTDMKSGIGKMRVVSNSKQTIEVDSIRYDIETDREGDFLDYGIEMGSGEVRNDELEQAGLQLRKIHFDMGVDHLHIATMQKMTEALKATYASPDTANLDAANMEAAILQPLVEHGMELLKHDPEFVIDRIGFETPDGAGLIKGVIKLVNVNEQDFPAGLESIVQKIVADFTVEVSQAVIEKLPNGATMAGAAIDSGYVKREDGKLVSRIELRNGQLTINGKTENIPIPGMAGMPPANTTL